MSKSGWGSSNRRQELPADWDKRRALAAARANWQCEHVGPSGARCKRRGTDADHAGHRMDHDNLQWLCPEHHKRKTAQESWRAKLNKRRKGARRRRDDHPGAL